jgi:glutathione S-transferase
MTTQPLPKLYIGNKNYSSWSMRPWVLMRHFGLPFEEVMVRFDSMEPGSLFKQRVQAVSPVGRVPVLVLEDGLAVWDTLAICETLADRHATTHALWPREARARARARSLTAEMHSGFGALRSHCPMNIEAKLHAIGPRVLREHPEVAQDLQRLSEAWGDALQASGGPFLFGDFCIADAFFAPVCARLRSYGLPASADQSAYIERVWASPGVAAWVRDALQEKDFVAFDEPYRSSRD